MNKNVLSVLAAATCALSLVSCDIPKDLRPEEKVSVDFVEPGTRSTYNVSDAGDNKGEAAGTDSHSEHKEDGAMLNHDPGANTIQKGDSIPEAAKANAAEGVDNR
ncbi:hypothetical protein [Pontibacter arcticus]|uniref:Lipoprotein n=1 Tax=Pontibacter arcticus TaxID=2080288 RepID=A0A364RJ61_9BACT|nr:hypothetical protein [Pontibacter arcticus]RAU84313.1 hypothetical protein DP923_04540 [Pontibacter arcticus]